MIDNSLNKSSAVKASAALPPEWAADVRSWLEKAVAPGDRLLVAVSGGADSVGLLALLTDVFGYGQERIVVAHVNHSLRSTAERDLQVARFHAEHCRLQFAWRKVDVLGVSHREHLSVEAAARRLRYEALREMAAETSCRWILTGHTLDDSAETVLMRLLSGAPWYECTGIPRQRESILRPLLAISRAALRAWVDERNLSYVEDESNSDLRLQRNRLRSIISTNYNYWTNERIQDIARSGETMAHSLALARKLADAVFFTKKQALTPDYLTLAIHDILSYFSNLSFLPVEQGWARLVQRENGRLASHQRKQIVGFLQGCASAGQLSLPDHVLLLKRADRLWICRDFPQPVHREVGVGHIEFAERKSILTIGRSDHAAPPAHAMLFNIELLSHNLFVRSWQPGDRIKLPGRPTKKISDLLSEQRRDPIYRAGLLVLADEKGPLALLGDALAECALPKQDDPITAWLTLVSAHESDEPRQS
jgi:tRNA(Ile)-lysidine synthase